MPALGDKYDVYESAVLRLGDVVHPYISNMASSPACWMSCCDEDGDMKTVADLFSVSISSEQSLCRFLVDLMCYHILSERAGSSLFFNVVMHIVCFALTMYMF